MKRLLRAAMIGTGVTILLAATFHLLLLFIVAIAKGDTGALNPVSFLGLNLVFNNLTMSPDALYIGWAILIGTGAIIAKLVLEAEQIVAFWYTTNTYNRFIEQSASIKRRAALLGLPTKGLRVKHFRSLNLLIQPVPPSETKEKPADTKKPDTSDGSDKQPKTVTKS